MEYIKQIRSLYASPLAIGFYEFALSLGSEIPYVHRVN
jgi:hypothetical protein